VTRCCGADGVAVLTVIWIFLKIRLWRCDVVVAARWLLVNIVLWLELTPADAESVRLIYRPAYIVGGKVQLPRIIHI
jgi:hypothetical protein